MQTHLSGRINEKTDIFENEYPAIEAAHNKADAKSRELSENDPLLDQKFDDWNTESERKLREAHRFEKSRGNELTRRIQ